MRFHITWVNEPNGGYVGYKVSDTRYSGGDVVSIDEVEEIEDALVVAEEQIAKNEKALEALKAQIAELKRDDPGHT